MKVLLDENLPHELRQLLTPAHDVFTVTYMGWSGIENGALLAKAAVDGFDVMVTKDQGIAYQQNLVNLPVAVVILYAKSNKIHDIQPLVPKLLAALNSLRPQTLVNVS
jgi:predicted nuclease of predicted toxin-antitoxin system